jgi:hypothetical protein
VSSYLAAWYNPALDTPDGVTPKELEKEEVERLTMLLSVAQAAGEMKRRIADADDRELAVDKKRCRRIGHVALKSLGSWGCKKPKVADVAREAAIVDWARWWQDHQLWLDNRRIFIATWAQKYPDHQRWAKSAIVKLTNETTWLQYAMRD